MIVKCVRTHSSSIVAFSNHCTKAHGLFKTTYPWQREKIVSKSLEIKRENRQQKEETDVSSWFNKSYCKSAARIFLT